MFNAPLLCIMNGRTHWFQLIFLLIVSHQIESIGVHYPSGHCEDRGSESVVKWYWSADVVDQCRWSCLSGSFYECEKYTG